MLVLSRKQEEKILIGENITITILKVRGNTVRIGIDAPKDVHVMRGELSKQDAEQKSLSPVTVAVKSNGNNSQKCSPSLRVIGDEEAEISRDDQTTASPPVHRLQELVSKVATGESP